MISYYYYHHIKHSFNIICMDEIRNGQWDDPLFKSKKSLSINYTKVLYFYLYN